MRTVTPEPASPAPNTTISTEPTRTVSSKDHVSLHVRSVSTRLRNSIQNVKSIRVYIF